MSSTTLATDGVELTEHEQGLDLDWGYWDAQLETLAALDSGEYDVVVYRGGYGSGKSVLGARWIIETALATPDGHSLAMGQDFAKGEGSTYTVFFEQLPGENTVPKDDDVGDPENSPVVSGYNRNKKRLTFRNGHVVRLGSADKWNRYAGAEFNAIWCDEVAHYGTTNLYKLNEMLISRQRTQQGPNVTLWTSTGNGFNQFYDFVERQVTPDEEELPTRVCNVVADSRNNPFLNEAEKLTRQFGGTQREDEALAGGFAAAEGLVYSGFSREDHVISDEHAQDLVEDNWRIYGYDAGWDHERVVVEIGRTSYDQFVVTDLFYERETTIEDVVDPTDADGEYWMADRPDGTVYAEHEPEHVEKFSRAGYPAQNAIKNLDDGIDHVRARLTTDSEGRPGLLVAQSCVPLVQEFLSYQQEHVGRSDADDHALDALRYALYTHEHRGGDASGPRDVGSMRDLL